MADNKNKESLQFDIKIFLDICQTTISQLGKEHTPKEISEKTQMLIDLFKEMPNKLSSIVGLWGELFLIASSKNTTKCSYSSSFL